MSMTAEEALAELATISERLSRLPNDAPDRAQLEARQTVLRTAVREASDRAKPAEALMVELAQLERRLIELEGEAIKPSIGETRKRWLTDPSAYARTINERIDAATRDDRDRIERRIAELRHLLDDDS